VFYPRITEAAHRGENLTRLIIKATFSLAAVGFIPFAVIVAFGPWLFGFVFGSEWVMAGEYARWLALMMFFFFINKPAVVAVPVLDLQKGLLFYEVFSTGSKLLAMYIGFIIFQNDIIVVALFGVFGAIAYITLISWVIFSSFALEKRRQHV
jgi:O-antigen/teichoic acid export membrane protein